MRIAPVFSSTRASLAPAIWIPAAAEGRVPVFGSDSRASCTISGPLPGARTIRCSGSTPAVTRVVVLDTPEPGVPPAGY